MTESKAVDLLAVFPDLEPAANAIEHLRSIGVHDDCMNVISGIYRNRNTCAHFKC